MNLTWINRGPPYWPSINIAKVEQHYNAIYVGDFPLWDKEYWTDQAFSVFFVEEPEKSEYSNYFGLYINSPSSVWITNAVSVTEGYWDGIVADDGEIIYSRFRHDFRSSTDGTVTVDGGRDYQRICGHIHNPRVRLSIIREHIVVNDTLFLPYVPPLT